MSGITGLDLMNADEALRHDLWSSPARKAYVSRHITWRITHPEKIPAFFLQFDLRLEDIKILEVAFDIKVQKLHLPWTSSTGTQRRIAYLEAVLPLFEGLKRLRLCVSVSDRNMQRHLFPYFEAILNDKLAKITASCHIELAVVSCRLCQTVQHQRGPDDLKTHYRDIMDESQVYWTLGRRPGGRSIQLIPMHACLVEEMQEHGKSLDNIAAISDVYVRTELGVMPGSDMTFIRATQCLNCHVPLKKLELEKGFRRGPVLSWKPNTPLPSCRKCNMIKYCSESCATADWHRCHKYRCISTPMGTWNGS